MYAVISYTNRHRDDNYVEIKQVVADVDTAKKLAFYHATKNLPAYVPFARTNCKIVQDYFDEEGDQVHIENEIVVSYRIAEVLYNDDEEDDEYTIECVYNTVWAVIHFMNKMPADIPDIDNKPSQI